MIKKGAEIDFKKVDEEKKAEKERRLDVEIAEEISPEA